MGAIIPWIVKAVASGAIFAAAQTVLEKFFDEPEETVEDELYAAGITAGFFSVSQLSNLKATVKDLPMPNNITTAKEAANFLENIVVNKQALAALNTRFGGYAPLVIKFTKSIAGALTKKNIILAGITFERFKTKTSFAFKNLGKS